jgi:phosphate-selective porin OprO/OprP
MVFITIHMTNELSILRGDLKMILFHEKDIRRFLNAGFIAISFFSMVFSVDSTNATVTADKNGFSIKGANNFELQFKGYAQSVGYFGVSDENNMYTDQFVLRRARLDTRVKAGPNIQMRIHGEFASTPQVLDAYLQINLFDPLNLQFGLFKSPLSMERLQPATALLFSDFAYTASVAPNRDIGIQVSGKPFSGILKYQVAVVNGAQDGSSSSGDTKDSKELVGRVLLSPFAKNKKNIFSSFALGVGGSYGMHDGEALSSFRTSGRTKVFNYKSTCLSDGRLYRIAPQLQWFSGKYSLIGEYIQNRFKIADTNGFKADLSNYSWAVSSGLIILNGCRTEKGFKIDMPLNISKKQFGGLELVARVNAINIDNSSFGSYASSVSSISSIVTVEGGLNWLLNDNACLHLAYCTTRFKDGAASGNRAPENSITLATDLIF